MKKPFYTLLALGLTSTMLLTGCKKSKIVDIDDKQYIKNGDEYTQIAFETKTFLPGEHTIYYNSYIFKRFISEEDGWGNVDIKMPSIPDGYKLVDILEIGNKYYGYTSNIIYVFENEVPVEATSSYNAESDSFGFFEPGVPVKSLKLD